MRFTPDTIKTIAFDADDTLWVNETYYQEVQSNYLKLLSHHLPKEQIIDRLQDVQIANLAIFGYGAKGFMLSLIETAIELTEGAITGREIQQIINMVRAMLEQPINVIDGVRHVLDSLDEDYTLMIITKGDLLDQETKIARSDLSQFFRYAEILSEKTPEAYQRLLDRLDINPAEFVMIGNSPRSDILPILQIGGHAIHIPFGTTWAHEQVTADQMGDRPYLKLDDIRQVLDHFDTPIRHS